MIKLLLDHQNIKVNKQSIIKIDNKEYTEPSLNTAIRENKNIEVVKLLLDNPNIDINLKSKIEEENCKYEETPLIIAIKNKNIEIVKLLLENQNIDINMKSNSEKNEDKYEETALTIAIENKNIEIIKLLLNHPKINLNIIFESYEKTGNKQKTIKEQIIHKVVKTGDKKIVELFLKESKIDINSKMLIKEITKNDDADDENNKNIKKETTLNTSLHIAVLDNANDIVSLLISHEKININKRGTNYIENKEHNWNALNMAVYKKQVETCKLLLSNESIDVNAMLEIEDIFNIYEKKSPLFLSVENESEEIVQLLLNHHEIDVNCKSFCNHLLISEVKETYVLHKAFEIKNVNIIKKLINCEKTNLNVKSNIKKIIDSNNEDEYHCTLNLAIEFGNVEIIKLLISKDNIDIENTSIKISTNNNGYNEEENNIIETSLKCQNKEIAKLIIEYLRKNNHKLLMNKINSYIEMSQDNEIKGILLNIANT